MASTANEQGTCPPVVPAEVPQVSTGCNGRRAVADEPLAYPTVVETSYKTARVSALAEENEEEMDARPCCFSGLWTSMVLKIRTPFIQLLHVVAGHAARHPTIHIISTILLSLALFLTGVNTNVNIVVYEFDILTPKGSPSLTHKDWLDNESGFPKDPRYLSLIVHANSRNVLGKEGMQRVFQAFNTVRNQDGYSPICQTWEQLGRTAHVDENGGITCETTTPTTFWRNDVDLFEQEVSTDAEAIEALSHDVYPSGMTVDPYTIFGNAKRDGNGLLTTAESYKMVFLLPDHDDTPKFEENTLDALMLLRDEWNVLDDAHFRLEVYAHRSFVDEFSESAMKDIPLVPVVFALMIIFTCVTFWRRDAVHSRSLLGVGAISTILLTILTGYGLLFTIGVPQTTFTNLLLFIIFGIGINKTFILSGAFRRTDKSKDIPDRIHDMVNKVGFSIFLTSSSSAIAFGFGSLSSVPAVCWLCLYAFPTILIDFVYQITFFVAVLVLDERRVRARRRDCPLCCSVRDSPDEPSEEPEERVVDKFMTVYSNILMKSWTKAVVIVSFSALLGGCIYSATMLEQSSLIRESIPSSSYVQAYWDVLDEYAEGDGVVPYAYFRFVDQGDESTQQQMGRFVDDLVGNLDEVSNQPTYFWVRDFQNFTADNEISALPFKEQMDLFLNNSVFAGVYSDKIVRDEEGNVVASRVWFRMDQVEMFDVKDEVEALSAQSQVAEGQPVNEGIHDRDWSFFTLADTYLFWEYYSVATDEFIVSIVTAIVSVTVLCSLFIPHWSAFFLVCSIICSFYAGLLGVLQFSGKTINVATSSSSLVSIGVFVEFIVHILVRYFESSERTREGRVKDALRTIGGSILMGGLSMLIGIIPLAFSSHQPMHTVFVACFAMVTLGLGHGLIFLPVLLSMAGTTEATDTKQLEQTRPVIATPGNMIPDDEDEEVAKATSPAVARNIGTNTGSSDGSSATTVRAETPVIYPSRAVDGEDSVVESVDTRGDADVLREAGLDRLESIKDCRQWRRSRRGNVASVPEEDEHDDDVSALQPDDDDDADLDAHDEIHHQKLMTLSC